MYAVGPQYSSFHPQVYSLLTKLPKTVHSTEPRALIEFEYVGNSPNAYTKPPSADAINILRIVAEGYKFISPDSLSPEARNEVRNIGFEHLKEAESVDIDQSRGEHQIW